MPACSRCLIEVSPGTALCPKCGAAIRPTVIPLPSATKRKKARRRLSAAARDDRIVGVAAVVLLVSFWLPWFGLGPFSVDGLSAHGWLFIALLDSIVLVVYALITTFGVGDLAAPGRMSKEQLLALMTGVNLGLVVLGFLLKPSGFGWSYGAFVALAAAFVGFLPFGAPLIRERRGR